MRAVLVSADGILRLVQGTGVVGLSAMHAHREVLGDGGEITHKGRK